MRIAKVLDGVPEADDVDRAGHLMGEEVARGDLDAERLLGVHSGRGGDVDPFHGSEMLARDPRKNP